MTSTITLEEIADRLAIRELIDAYAHCADRRDASGQMALFTEKTAFHVYMDSRSPEPTYVLPITAECRWIFLFLFPVAYIELWRNFGGVRIGRNHSHSMVPGGFEVMS